MSPIESRHLIAISLLSLIILLFFFLNQCQFRPLTLISSIYETTNFTNQSIIKTNSSLSRIIVISHFNEDLDWLDLFINNQIPYIVYTRSNDPLALHRIHINKGREAVAYLRYIVDNYSNLPSTIAFIHAHRTSWHQANPSDTVVALRALQWHKYSYVPLTSTTTNSKFQLSSGNQQFRVNAELWRDVFQKELGIPPVNGVQTYCCASFAVKKEMILAHPKSFYSAILDYIVASPQSDQITGRTLEYTWHMIFGQPAEITYRTCDIFVCDSHGAISVSLAEKS